MKLNLILLALLATVFVNATVLANPIESCVEFKRSLPVILEEETDTLDEDVQIIDKFAFLDCSSLENIKLTENAENISPWIFQNCTQLSSIEFPIHLENALKECLKKVYPGSGSKHNYTMQKFKNSDGKTYYRVTFKTGKNTKRQKADMDSIFVRIKNKSVLLVCRLIV